MLCAVEMALEAGVPTKTQVLNLLHRLIDESPTGAPQVAPPTGLALIEEPKAMSSATTACAARRRGVRDAS